MLPAMQLASFPLTAREKPAIVSIGDRNYGYTVQQGDELESVRDNLVGQISAEDPQVDAVSSTAFTRIVLRARVPGQEG
jgi:phage tail sheath gpL-like